MSKIIDNGFTYQISRKDLERAIMDVRGCIDTRTIDKWIKALTAWEYIQPIDGNRLYKINPATCPNLIAKLKEQPQTRLG